MSRGQNDTGVATFTAGGTIQENRRVKLQSDGTVVVAGAAEQSIGVSRASAVSGDPVAVRLKTKQGTLLMVASGAVSRAAAVFGAASGKISATANGNPEGVALEAATADGDIIEVLPRESLDAALLVSGVAAGYVLARGEVALDGGNPTTVATGLTTIVAAVACLKGSSAPGDNTSVVTVNFTGADGNLDLYGWKNTGGTDPTLAASTGTETVEWIAIGT